MTNIPLDQNSRATLAALSSVDGSVVPLYADPTTHRLLVDTTGTVGLNTIINTTGGTTTLTAVQNNSTSIEVTGLLTSNAILIVSDLKAPFVLDNMTTGAFTVTVKTLAGTGVTVAQGSTVMLYANGTNVETAVSTGGGSVTSVSVATANGFAGTVATATTTPAITLTTSITGVLKGNGTAISAASAGTDYVAPGSVTTDGITMNTAKMLGRATAGVGAVEEIATTGTGSAVLATSPTLVTPTIGVASATSVNKVAITAPATSATLTIADGKTLTASNTLTFTGTDLSSVAFGTGGTVAYTGGTLAQFAATTSAQLAGVISDETGSGALVFATSPSLTTPTLGVAAATTINKVTITAPAAGSTLTIADGKTLTASNTLTLVGTDATTMTFPSTSASIARTDAAQTFTGTQTFSQQVMTNNAITATTNAATVPITSRISTVTNNSAAGLTITMATASAVDGMLVQVRVLDFSAVAQTITWVNTENGEATAPASTNGSTTLPRSGLFQFNSRTSLWRCIAA